MEFDFLGQMIADLPHEFRDKEHINAFIKALAKQLEFVYKFFSEIRDALDLRTAVGENLDKLGEVALFSRAEVRAIIGDDVSDDIYRQYLKVKTYINTSKGTYKEVVAACKLIFGNEVVVTYQETPPAKFNIILGVDENTNINVLNLFNLHPAGVGVKYSFDLHADVDGGNIYLGVINPYEEHYKLSEIEIN